MYCPNQDCAHAAATGEPAQFRTGLTECTDCGTALVETEPVWPSEDVEYAEFVPVLSIHGEATVSFVKSLLRSTGIRFYIKNERVQDFFGLGRFGTGFSLITGAPVVFVERTRAAEAQELLAAIEDDLDGDS